MISNDQELATTREQSRARYDAANGLFDALKGKHAKKKSTRKTAR